jgi:hypothetical protein
VKGILLQDWLMLWGNTNSSNPVVQSDPDWFDASGYQDIVLWSQLGNCDGSAGTVLTLTYETAPIKSESTSPRDGQRDIAALRGPQRAGYTYLDAERHALPARACAVGALEAFGGLRERHLAGVLPGASFTERTRAIRWDVVGGANDTFA